MLSCSWSPSEEGALLGVAFPPLPTGDNPLSSSLSENQRDIKISNYQWITTNCPCLSQVQSVFIFSVSQFREKDSSLSVLLYFTWLWQTMSIFYSVYVHCICYICALYKLFKCIIYAIYTHCCEHYIVMRYLVNTLRCAYATWDKLCIQHDSIQALELEAKGQVSSNHENVTKANWRLTTQQQEIVCRTIWLFSWEQACKSMYVNKINRTSDH